MVTCVASVDKSFSLLFSLSLLNNQRMASLQKKKHSHLTSKKKLSSTSHNNNNTPYPNSTQNQLSLLTRDQFNETRDDGKSNGVCGLLAGMLRLVAIRHLHTLPHITNTWPTPPYHITSASQNNINNTVTISVSSHNNNNV